MTGGGGTTTQRIYDRNENYVEIRNATYNNHSSTEVVDQLGRLLRIEHGAEPNKDYIYQRGPNNNDIKWIVEWSAIQVFKTCYGVTNPQGWAEEEGGVTETLGVVSKITLPAEADSLTYEFGYNAQPETGINGWGNSAPSNSPPARESLTATMWTGSISVTA